MHARLAATHPLAFRLCKAVDTADTLDEVRAQLEPVRGLVGLVKFNSVHTDLGDPVIVLARSLGFGVFIDHKWADIPDTVYRHVASTRRKGVGYCTITIKSGAGPAVAAAIKAATEPTVDGQPPITVLGITELTSLTEVAHTVELGQIGTIKDSVLRLARLGIAYGIHGLVCSGAEVADVSALGGRNLLYATPGIRFAGNEVQDQNAARVVTPKMARVFGSSMLVMGRDLVDAASARRALVELTAAETELALLDLAGRC